MLRVTIPKSCQTNRPSGSKLTHQHSLRNLDSTRRPPPRRLLSDGHRGDRQMAKTCAAEETEKHKRQPAEPQTQTAAPADEGTGGQAERC